eukprot:5239689-Alexandrium_andersonii.AAC.1
MRPLLAASALAEGGNDAHFHAKGGISPTASRSGRSVSPRSTAPASWTCSRRRRSRRRRALA